MTITIRSARASDIPFILNGYFLIHRDAPMHTETVLTAEQIQRDVLGDEPKAFIDVAEINPGEPIGFAFYSTVYFASTGRVLWVTNLYVDPFVQDRGLASIGKMLISHARKTHPDAHGIYGCTERNNHNALGFFDRLGAKQLGHFVMLGTNEFDDE